MSNPFLQTRAEGLLAQLKSSQDLQPWEIAEIDAELADIGNALQRDGAAIGDPRSALEAARDLNDAETMATRLSDYPR